MIRSVVEAGGSECMCCWRVFSLDIEFLNGKCFDCTTDSFYKNEIPAGEKGIYFEGIRQSSRSRDPWTTLRVLLLRRTDCSTSQEARIQTELRITCAALERMEESREHTANHRVVNHLSQEQQQRK